MKKKNQHFNPGLVLALSLIIILSGTFIYMNSTSDSSFLALVKGDKKVQKEVKQENLMKPMDVKKDNEAVKEFLADADIELPEDIGENWLVEAQKGIEEMEYEIRESDQTGNYEVFNRKNKFNVKYTSNSFNIETENQSLVNFTLESIYKNENNKLTSKSNAEAKLNKKEVKFTHDNFVVKYKNTKDGSRDTYVVKQRPAGDGNLKVILNLETDLNYKVKNNELLFTDENNAGVLVYKDLKARDSNATDLEANMKLEDGKLILEVDDANAVYPIMIDPISQTPVWSAEGNQDFALFGEGMSSAGDVNGDGYDDVIIGAPFYDVSINQEGKVFCYYGSAAGLPITPNWTAEGTEEDEFMGRSVSSAGDVNGDGYDDVIVSSSSYGLFTKGKVSVYYGSASGLSATADWIIEGNNEYGHLGLEVSSAGDLNSDGYDDVIFAEGGYDGNNGRVFIYNGSNMGLSNVPAWSEEGTDLGEWFVPGEGAGDIVFGKYLLDLGDVNGDGHDDVMINDDYVAYVYYGSDTGISELPDWTLADEVVMGYINTAPSAGDFNGDGYNDVAFGTGTYSQITYGGGAASVYYGSASGLSATYDWRVDGTQVRQELGSSVSTADDFNGDGYDDLIVGASGYSNGQIFEGAIFIYFGSSTGLSNNYDWIYESDIDDTWLGSSASNAGDINGDGYDDMMIYTSAIDNGEANEGIVFVFYGDCEFESSANWVKGGNQNNALFGTSVSSAGDINGDNFQDLIIGAPLYNYNGNNTNGTAMIHYGSEDFNLTLPNLYIYGDGITAQRSLFGISVSSAGDVNGDGYDDVIIGAITNPIVTGDSVFYTGPAFVYHGSEAGLSTVPAWTLESDQSLAGLASKVSSAGDVNGDGYDDVIIGVPDYSNNKNEEGIVFVYHGSASGLSTNPEWTREGEQDYANFGHSVSSAGDVNGDGYDDVIIGAPNYSSGENREGIAAVYYGSSSGISLAADWTGEEDQNYAKYGFSVAGAKDVNGDGYDDVIIGSPYYDNGLFDEGMVFSYYGSASGLSTTADWTKEIDREGALFGWSVASAGFLNRDNYADVIMGAPFFGNTYYFEGIVYAYAGSEDGLEDDYLCYSVAEQAYALYGFSISGADDFDGNSYDDIVIGAPFYDSSRRYTNDGQAYLYTADCL